MGYFNILLVFLVAICTVDAQEMHKKNKGEKEYTVYGEDFNVSQTINASDVLQKYTDLKVSDTIRTNFAATVKEVCRAKGCWMKLELKGGKEAMVRFKDYGFFVPMDIKGKKVIVSGKAFVSSISVANLRHYAKDAGASTTDIAKIRIPKKTFGFLATGVAVTK